LEAVTGAGTFFANAKARNTWQKGARQKAQTLESMMRSIAKPVVVISLAAVSVGFSLGGGDAVAQSNRQRPVVVVPYLPPPPPSPYAPYYYSPWNPNSAYSVYDHLSGGRQQCQLPTEPCDNNHRVTN
jgi:hypothetical protein